jgi:hypothetical protein
MRKIKKPKFKNMQHLLDSILSNKNAILVPLTAEYDNEHNIGSFNENFEKQWVMNVALGPEYDLSYDDPEDKFHGFSDYSYCIRVISKIDESNWQIETYSHRKIDIERKKPAYSGVNDLSVSRVYDENRKYDPNPATV